MVDDSSQPTSFVLPDLMSYCTYPLIYHSNGDEIDKQSVEWLISNCPDLSPEDRYIFRGWHAGKLTAFCYNAATPERLRVITDLMNHFFYMDTVSDSRMTRETEIKVMSNGAMKPFWISDCDISNSTAPGKKQPADLEGLNHDLGKFAQDAWSPCIAGAGSGVQERFRETMKVYFEATKIQAKARDVGIIPDLESYIETRRKTSGTLTCLALIEDGVRYGLDIDLPDFVVEHHIIKELNRWTNDFVSFSNDIFSYEVEQANGNTYNMIVVLMKGYGHTLQSAVDYVGDFCIKSLAGFQRDRDRLPSWGPEIDSMVEKYVEGLQSWIVGSLHWSFQTHRYFGENGAEFKETGIVRLSSKA